MSVTVPVALTPPGTALGETDSAASEAGLTTRFADTVLLPSDPEIETVVAVTTPVVLMVKLPVV